MTRPDPKGRERRGRLLGLHDARPRHRRDRLDRARGPASRRGDRTCRRRAASRPTTASRPPRSTPPGSASTRRVLTDAIAAVDLAPGDGERALEEMGDAGVTMWRDGDAVIGRALRARSPGGVGARRLARSTACSRARPAARAAADPSVDRHRRADRARLGRRRRRRRAAALDARDEGGPGPRRRRSGSGREARRRSASSASRRSTRSTITEFEPPTRFAIAHEGSFTGEGPDHSRAGAPTGRRPSSAGTRRSSRRSFHTSARWR